VNNLGKVAERFKNSGTITGQALKDYLENNIDYIFDDRKKKAVALFLQYLAKL